MKTGSMILLAGALVLAGATAAWVVAAGDPEPPDEFAEPGPGPREGKGHEPPLFGEKEAKSIRRGKRALEARVARLEEEVKALRRELRLRHAVGGASGGDVDAENPEFSDAVRDIVEEDRAERIERETDMRRERAEERMSETLADLVKEVDLDEKQEEAIAAAWSTELDKLLPLFIAARSGDKDWRDVREEITKVREGTDADAKAVLTEAQYEAYLEARPRGPGRRGDRRRGPGRN